MGRFDNRNTTKMGRKKRQAKLKARIKRKAVAVNGGNAPPITLLATTVLPTVTIASAQNRYPTICRPPQKKTAG